MDWWKNDAPADTSAEDELRYRLLRQMLLEADVEFADAQESDPGSIINGGSGVPVTRREGKR